jgi:hypothetical protein
LRNYSQKKDGTKALSAIYGPSGPIVYPINKANIIAECLENQFTAHDLCDCELRWHVEATVAAMLATVDENTILEIMKGL